jgi:hypothetical protein
MEACGSRRVRCGGRLPDWIATFSDQVPVSVVGAMTVAPGAAGAGAGAGVDSGAD